MGRDAEAARIRLAVSDPLPAHQQQQTAKEKQCFKTSLIEKFLFSSILQTSLDIEHYFTQTNRSNHNCPYGLDRKTSLKTICKLTSRTVL
jgi:hypothetical protein